MSFAIGASLAQGAHCTTMAQVSAPAPLDQLQRPLRSLRLSVTDRCNLRCAYCMPEEHYQWLPRPDILSYGELSALVELFAEAGVNRVRLTGGEPLLRRDLFKLVERLRSIHQLNDIALTTNGLLLQDNVKDLHRAGLDRLTISLDTLDADKFRSLTRRDGIEQVFAGLRAANEVGFTGTKVNSVIMRGTNEDEIPALLDFAIEHGAELRFIEYMDVGGASGWQPDLVFSGEQILARIRDSHGDFAEIPSRDAAPANRYRLENGACFGVIASTTTPFCANCDRSRVTADGLWFRCLYATSGIDLRQSLRAGKLDEVRQIIFSQWESRTDRGAAERAEIVLSKRQAQSTDPDNIHLEMHVRGG